MRDAAAGPEAGVQDCDPAVRAGAASTDVSVIVACHDAAGTLAETLEGLTAQAWERPWEIVLADNGSRDASVRLFAEHAARHPGIPMRVVDASARTGKSFALNVAIRAAAGRSLLFCDADDVVAPGWLARMGAALDRHGFVAARMDFEMLNPGWVRDTRDHPQRTRLLRLPFAPYCAHAGGGTFGFRREVFERVGDFDLDCACLEDTDYCIRAHLAGVELVFVPEAVVHVRFRSDPRAIYRQAYSYARARAQLRGRYAPDSAGPALPAWLGISRRALRMARWRLALQVRSTLGRSESPLERARFSRQLGATMGELAGALAFRVPPAA